MHDESSASRVPVCPICRRPVWLTEAKTDENGQAIHEGCYVEKIHLVRAQPIRSDMVQSDKIQSDMVQSDGDQAGTQSRGSMDAAKKKARPDN